jgi:hypothetical protein
MNIVRKISKLFTLLLITLTFSSQSAEGPENANVGWLSYAGSTLMNGYSGFKQFLSNITTTNDSFPFGELPTDTQTEIIKLLASSCTNQTLKEFGQTINALAQANKHLNKLINNPDFNLTLIKNRAKQFNKSDVAAAKAFQTQASKTQLKIQLVLAKIVKNMTEEQENENVLPRLNKLLKGFKVEDQNYKVDLNFTYRWNTESEEYSSSLMQAVHHDNKFLINYLLKNGANINQAGFHGKTPLMYADDPEIITLLAKEPNLNINQQDTSGNTALLRTIQEYFPEDIDNRENSIAIMQTLLDHGANPTIANNNGETPLQAANDTGDEEVIDLIQQAIDAL